MKFIVTYYNSTNSCSVPLVIYSDDFQTVQHLEFECNNGFRGCVCKGDYIYVVDDNRLLRFDRDFKLGRATKFGSDNHSLGYKEGKLYLVSTGEGMIYIIDIEDWALRGTLRHGQGGDSHINSISFIGNYPVVTVHNMNNEGYIYMMASSLEWGDGWENNIVIARGLSQPHDFRLIDDGYVFSNSRARQVVCRRVPVGNSWKTELPSYPRGMAIVGDYAYVGCSKRGDVESYIAKLELSTGEVVDQFKLPDEYGTEIYSVVAIEE